MSITQILIALALGTGFGFALQKAGLTQYHKIVNVFRFTDLAVLKFMLTALSVAMAGPTRLGVTYRLSVSALYDPHSPDAASALCLRDCL